MRYNDFSGGGDRKVGPKSVEMRCGCRVWQCRRTKGGAQKIYGGGAQKHTATTKDSVCSETAAKGHFESCSLRCAPAALCVESKIHNRLQIRR